MKMILSLFFISNFWIGVVTLKNVKHLKKINKELMPVAGHPKRWKDGKFFACQKMKKKEIELFTVKY